MLGAAKSPQERTTALKLVYVQVPDVTENWNEHLFIVYNQKPSPYNSS